MGNTRKTLFETSLTDTKKADVEGVGVLREDELGNLYRWVKNRNATALEALQAVCYDADNLDGTETDGLESVNMPVTNDLMVAAGIAMTAFGISGALCYGWVQVQGYCRNAQFRNPATTASAVGDELICEDGSPGLARSEASKAGTAPIYSSHFICMEVVATDGTGTAITACDVLIKCL